MKALILILFCANQLFAQDNPLLGKWIMLDECSFTEKGNMNTKYCQSDLGIIRESYELFKEDNTYECYYKNRDWERALYNIKYSDYTEGTYTVEGDVLKYSDKALEGEWKITIDNNILTLYNAESNKMAHYVREKQDQWPNLKEE